MFKKHTVVFTLRFVDKGYHVKWNNIYNNVKYNIYNNVKYNVYNNLKYNNIYNTNERWSFKLLWKISIKVKGKRNAVT